MGDEPAHVHEHLTAGDLSGPGHRRQRRSRQPDLSKEPSRRRAGVQRAHRGVRVELPHDPAGGRVRQRHLGGRLLVLHRIGQCLGAVHRGRRAWAGVSARQHAEQRLLRWPSQGGQPLRRVHRLSRCQHRQAGLAFPDGASRNLGLRPPRAPEPDHHSGGRRDHRRGGGGGEDRIRLRLRSGHRRTGVADRGASGAGKRRARRAGRPDPALPHEASAVRPSGVQRGRSAGLHSRAEGDGARGRQGVSAGHAVHPAVPGRGRS